MKRLIFLTFLFNSLITAEEYIRFIDKSGFSYTVPYRNELAAETHVKDLFDNLGY